MIRKYITLTIMVQILLTAVAIADSDNSINNKVNIPINNIPNNNSILQNHIPVCIPMNTVNIRCHARVIVDNNGKPLTKKSPYGYSPSQFLGAYNLSGVSTSNQIIAIIDAYDHPNISSDLRTYSKTFHIPVLKDCPVSTGTPKSPCFQKIDQRGGISYPRTDIFWALEIALDVEIAHAICQNCNILLVEADSNSYSDMTAAFDQAVEMGATVISNSYGSGEFVGENVFDNHFNISGIAITFSSGDSGYGTDYPASSPYVTSVGGTSLNIIGNSYINETVWGGTGSGCSLYEAQPLFQTDLGLAGCTNRIQNDISADADPRTGAAIYDSVPIGNAGWFKVGGTSLSSPIIAGTYALAGKIGVGLQGNSLLYTKGNNVNLHDIIDGSNGLCDPSYLCTAVAGYDGPTGLGSINGTGAIS